VLTEGELRESVEEVYEAFLRGEVEVSGKDLCDMGTSGGLDKAMEEFSIVNVMLPRQYRPSWQGNLFERRTAAIVAQLFGRNSLEDGCREGEEMEIDYDQILAKRPGLEDGTFAWHQDLAYWPPFTSSQETATCWLALDDSTTANGCMRFLPGSHREAELRVHHPLCSTGREESHALFTMVDEGLEEVHYVEIGRGDITVHNERVVHGSGPNTSQGWRRAYVLAYRRSDCIAEERRLGFTHSHNDTFSWDQFHQHQSSSGRA